MWMDMLNTKSLNHRNTLKTKEHPTENQKNAKTEI